MRKLILSVLGLTLALAVAHPAASQTAPAGVRGELLAQLDDAATKLVQLAEAFPQDKYLWRPATGVRSVSEVLMHVAGANVFFPTFVGVQPAMRLERSAETSVTDKAQVIATLKRSFDEARAAIRNLPDSDLDKAATMFGQQTTYRGVYLTSVSHMHEHLGQLVAYARMNGIVPPWSASGQ
jgi:uncharacterized damage-inducible protein DinB